MSAFSALYGIKSVINGKFCVTLPVPAPDAALADRTVIVTGANSGLGFETCLHLSRIGVGRLILAVRTPAKGEAARQKILDAMPSKHHPITIEVWQLDMDNYTSVREFAARCAQDLDRIDGVLAGAGIMTTKLNFSDSLIPGPAGNEKVEQTLQVNVISTLYLYLLLLPQMRTSAERTGVACRFAIPNSALHYTAPTAELVAGAASSGGKAPKTTAVIDRLNDPAKADMAGRYPLSKLLVLYAVRELASRGMKATGAGGRGVVFNTPNPSFCKSDLARETAESKAFQTFEKVIARTAEEGSRTLVHGLLAGPETDGQYLSDCKVEIPARHVTSKWGQDIQKCFVDEVLVKLERVHPGISSNV
ncbi:retinol dehydrogenase 12 [Microdochium nivale]|nr:retinol dehydrogenase 12 [Microdochium nivale]